MLNSINEINWKRDQLWKGCVLASIAHAIMVAHYTELAYEHSWDGINYSIQDSEGSRGTITFHTQFCIGAFRDDKSDRMKSINSLNNVKKYFVGAPRKIKNLGEMETLQYMLEDINGKPLPIITTAFWGIGERIFTRDTIEEMYQNGGYLIERQMMNFDSSVKSWVEYYDMSSKQCELLEKVFKQKIIYGINEFPLSKDDIKLIGTDDTDGLEISRTSFREMGIIWK